MDDALSWLLEDANPAVQYRARTQLLREEADGAATRAWITRHLPERWQERRGLWYTYGLTALAECGLTRDALPIIDEGRALEGIELGTFDLGCEGFMRLRALVMLGYHDHPGVAALLAGLGDTRLPDGGYLCQRRLRGLGHMLKSCMKANLYALLLAGECKKRGVSLPMTEPLLAYFWQHRLFYRREHPGTLVLDAREGWRTIDTFHPPEAMRVGLHCVVEAFCALGYGRDARLGEAWALLLGKADAAGRYPLEGTLSRSYLPRERAGAASKWVTLYALLAQRQRDG